MTFSQYRRIGELAAIVLSMAAASVAAFAACNDIALANQAQIPSGTNVKVTLGTAEPSGTAGVVQEVLNELSNQVNGITFTLTETEPEVGASILVEFGGSGGDDAGLWTASPGNDGTLRTGTVKVYTDQTNCDGAGGLCYDPSKLGYRDAIKRTLIHEFTHSLGATNSTGANVMGPFAGTNNLFNPTLDLDCVFARLGQLLAPPPPSTGVCG